MQNGNLHLPKKFGLYQRAVDLYLCRWIKDAKWKFTFPEEVWIIPTRGGFVPMKTNKRCRMEIYIYRRSLDYTNARWISTYEDEWKMQNGNLHLPKTFGLYQRAVDLYLWRWIKDAEWKFTFTKEVWIIPTRVDLYLCRWIKDAEWKFTFTEEVWIILTRGGFVPMKMNKRCRMEIYIYRRSLDYTNAWWICT